MGALGDGLSGKRIVLCITGSVAAVTSAELARTLMRHGADVFPVMTEAACGIIHPDLMHWATGNPAVTHLTGAIEHVSLAGNVPGKADLILVAPSTANTIGKIRAGIDDTPVTTVVTTALGEQIPVMVVPAMHEPMYRHQVVTENLGVLHELGVSVVMPRIAEGKAKIAETAEVLDAVYGVIGPHAGLLAGRQVLITAGRTVEYIDPIRVITNNSTGKMGAALARAALRAGATVTVVYGRGTAALPAGARVVKVETAADMERACRRELEGGRYALAIAAAAVGDWRVPDVPEEKISTHGRERLTLELVPTAKIVDGMKKTAPNSIVMAFRALHAVGRDALLEDAGNRLQSASADLIAVNDVSKPEAGFEVDTNELVVLSSRGETWEIAPTTKEAAAERLISIAAEYAGWETAREPARGPRPHKNQ